MGVPVEHRLTTHAEHQRTRKVPLDHHKNHMPYKDPRDNIAVLKNLIEYLENAK